MHNALSPLSGIVVAAYGSVLLYLKGGAAIASLFYPLYPGRVWRAEWIRGGHFHQPHAMQLLEIRKEIVIWQVQRFGDFRQAPFSINMGQNEDRAMGYSNVAEMPSRRSCKNHGQVVRGISGHQGLQGKDG